MKVFLLQNVAKLGKHGDLIIVKPGFARNFLLPRQMAVAVTTGTQKQVDEQKKQLALTLNREEKRASLLKDKLEQNVITVAVNAGKDDKIFGSVTGHHIQKALKEQSIILDRRKLNLEGPIHKLGDYQIPVRLSSTVEASLKLKVVRT